MHNNLLIIFFQNQAEINVFGSLPSVVFSNLISGIIGAFIALFGTRLQNNAHANRQKELLLNQSEQQKERLFHEAEQRRLDREMTLRREVYLSAAESVAKLSQYLFALADTSLTSEKQNEVISGVWESINKVTVVGKIETVKALFEINKVFSKNVGIMLIKSKKVHLLVSQENELQTAIQNNTNKMHQLSDLMQSPNISNDKEFYEKLKVQFTNCMSELNGQKANLLGIQNQINEVRVELYKQASKSSSEFEMTAAKANFCIRRELDIPFTKAEENEYLSDFAKLSEEIYSNGERVFNELDTILKN